MNRARETQQLRELNPALSRKEKQCPISNQLVSCSIGGIAVEGTPSAWDGRLTRWPSSEMAANTNIIIKLY